MMKIFLITILVFILTFPAKAQNQNPPSVKWKQMKTPHFRIIYPEDIGFKALEAADYLERSYIPGGKSLNSFPGRYPVVLFNQGTISNGYTTLIPRHIGFYTTPPQNPYLTGSTNWLQTLSIHEYRHAVQFRKLNQNLNSYFGNLFGNYGLTICMNLSVPFWVFEGDAVCTETLLTLEGRGRLPSFERDIRALELENKHYSYYKAYLGSYRNYYPDHYHLGYLLTSYIRKNYGLAAYDRILESTTKIPLPTSYSRQLLKNTGYDITATYNNCMAEFKEFWQQGRQLSAETDFHKISPHIRRGFTSYLYPFYSKTGGIIALRSGFDDAPVLVRLEDNKEQKLIEINPNERVHSNGSQLVWSAFAPDIRWGQRNYSNICIYDIKKDEFRIITGKGKYFAPAISPDGTKIAAVEYGPDMNCSLVILDPANGSILVQFLLSSDEFARLPEWSEDGSRLATVITVGQRRKLSVVDITSGEWKDLIPLTTESIANPVFFGDYILFHSGITGTDAVHALLRETGERFLVCHGKYGSYSVRASPDGSNLILQNYTTSGHEIAEVPVDIRTWERFNPLKSTDRMYYNYLMEQENGRNIFSNATPAEEYPTEIKRYRPLLRSIQVHSWAPYPVRNGIGFSVFSNDILNTTSIEAGINYFSRDAAHREYLEITYAGLFPVLRGGVSAGRNYVSYSDSTDSLSAIKIREKIASMGFYIPLDLSGQVYTTHMSAGAGLHYIMAEITDESVEPGKLKLLAPEISFSFSRARQRSFRDIHPRYAQEFSLLWWNSPFRGYPGGYRYILSGKLYVPGAFNHHNLILSGGMESNTAVFREGVYQLTTDLEFVRGYRRNPSDRILKGMVEYTMPLFYPDLALGPVLYIKRVSSNFFYDNALTNLEGQSTWFNSAGIDLNFTVHWFGLIIPWEMGVRYSYCFQNGDHVFNFLLFGASF